MLEVKGDLSESVVRKSVVKDSDSRLQAELSLCQTVYGENEIKGMSRYQLVGLVTLLRLMNKATTSCKTVIKDFNPKNASFSEDDNTKIGRSQSVSDVDVSGEGTSKSSKLAVSQPVSVSLASHKNDLVARLELLQLDLKQEREDKERKDRLDREERERIGEDRERKERLDREERERIREEKERIRREEKE